jgi:hypothetical protein
MFPLFAGSNPSGYNLTRSVRTRASASANLSRTFGAAPTVRTKQTLSVWFKRGTLSTEQVLMAGYDGVSAGGTRLVLLSGNTVEFHFAASTSLITTQVFRDPSAWYHIVLSIDTTQATASNRVKLYVNGSQITAFGTANYPSQNALSQFTLNNGNNKIASQDNNANYFDGYLAEVNFIDGQALTPSSFGSTNALTGVWQPARYTGTYGTNGFYLPFTDNSALTTSSNVGLGRDYSGNGNYWTTNNISITAGVTYDSMTDVPTLTSATAANFAVLNPLDNGGLTITNGNLNASRGSGGSWVAAKSTVGVASGKWYWEFTSTVNQSAGGPNQAIGISKASSPTNTYLGSDANSWSYFQNNGNKWTNNTSSAYGSGWASGDVIGVALDVDNGTLTFYKNNVSQGTAFTGLTSGFYFPSVSMENGSAGAINFGQRPFAYTPPTGFVALNTFNLPTSTIVKGNTVMDATTYSGTGSTQSIVNAAGFKPDFVWLKSRSAATNNVVYDSVRGFTKQLIIALGVPAETTESNGLTAFNSNGFSVGSLSTINTNAATYVGWQWQAGQGSSSSNTNGTITSTVSVNASAGFSVATYTGTGVNGATVGHGLGVAPSLIFAKARSTAGNSWQVYHSSLGNTGTLFLEKTDSVSNSSNWWNNTSPTSSVFSLGTSGFVNANTTTYVAYCWTPIAGYSAFGSLIGNGSSDGVFVYTGFRPKFVMMKSTSTGNWVMIDTARNPYNVAQAYLAANSSGAEATGSPVIDTLSNGFKIRTTWTDINPSGTSVIYAAFSEVPFKNSLGF